MLSQLATGAKGRVLEITGGKGMIRKLMGLGLKVGSEFELLHRRGRGVVVRSHGSRIAIGGNVADHLVVETSMGLAE